MRIFHYDIRRPLWIIPRWRERRRAAPRPASLDEPYAVASVSGIEIPPEMAMRRELPGPAKGQIPGFEALLDRTGLFYDVYWDAGEVVMIGPPLRNLSPLLYRARIMLDGVPVRRRVRTRTKDLLQITRLPAAIPPRQLTFDAGWLASPVIVRRPDRMLLQGRKVLFSKSKDNDPLWIQDWIDFHVRAHGADAVLLYDNGSTRYSPLELLALIRAVPGVAAAVVVPWPYKHGYHGPGFGGDYSQHVIIEHGRRRFLADAAGVLQVDVDELVVSTSGQSLFDAAAHSPVGAISFDGVWIENVGGGANPHPRHRDFRYAGSPVQKTKWAAVPRLVPDGVQMTVHAFEHGFSPTYSRDLVYRHFRAISTSWKYKRDEALTFDPATYTVDAVWVREMQRIGWSSAADDAAGALKRP